MSGQRPLIVVEILGVRGRARLRRRLRRLPATLGRGLECDVIIDDPQISAEHARVESDEAGQLWLVDLGSTNGIFGGQRSGRVTRVALEGDQRFRLGNTVIRVRLSGQAVERTQVAQALSAPLVTLVQRRLAAVGLLAAVAAWVALSSYLGEVSRQRLGTVFGTTLAVLLLLVAWSAAWAVASRMLTQRFRFVGHLASVALALLAVEVWDLLVGVTSYAVAAEGQASEIGFGGDILIAIWLLYMHLRFATYVQPRRVLRIAAIFVLAAALSVSIISRLNKAGFSAGLDFPSSLWPPAVQPRELQSVESFIEATQHLRTRADRLATEQ